MPRLCESTEEDPVAAGGNGDPKIGRVQRRARRLHDDQRVARDPEAHGEAPIQNFGGVDGTRGRPPASLEGWLENNSNGCELITVQNVCEIPN